MAGRKKHPNSPNATVAVRISQRAFDKVIDMHIVGEPFGFTIERALDEAIHYRKKTWALQGQVEGLETEVRTITVAFDRLFNVHQGCKRH